MTLPNVMGSEAERSMGRALQRATLQVIDGLARFGWGQVKQLINSGPPSSLSRGVIHFHAKQLPPNLQPIEQRKFVDGRIVSFSPSQGVVEVVYPHLTL
jgi:hypothetical protein